MPVYRFYLVRRILFALCSVLGGGVAVGCVGGFKCCVTVVVCEVKWYSPDVPPQ